MQNRQYENDEAWCSGHLEGLAANPDLKVVLLFGYEAYKTGAARFLNQLLEPLGRSNVLIAGGHVESVLPHKRDWSVLHRVHIQGMWTLSGDEIILNYLLNKY